MTLSGFLIPVISQSSLLDPPFVVYVIFFAVAVTTRYTYIIYIKLARQSSFTA